MKKAFGAAVLAVALTTVAIVSAQREPAPTMEVYKSPTCGCCTKWVEHVRAGGLHGESERAG